MLLLFLSKLGFSQAINQNDYNYLNKGYWEIAANGYTPRKDLTLTELSQHKLKVNNQEQLFIFNKVCKDSVFQGYIISAKKYDWKNEMYNYFLFNEKNSILEKHNKEVITELQKRGAEWFVALFQVITETQSQIVGWATCEE